jgi:prepilin-type N-terminal cleavage/methylation domain-containing protein
MKSNQSGFTLIEIAIVLVIIGLLLGGVLKGQELINSARVKNLANDFKNSPVFIYGYQDKFKALPGDDTAVASHVAGGTLATTPAGKQGNGIIDGNWNSTTLTDESILFWQHIRLAGFGPGSTTPSVAVGNDYIPRNAVGGAIGITNSSVAADLPITTLKGTYIVCSDGIPGKFAKQLDTTLDNGDTTTGSVQVTVAGTSSGGGAIAASGAGAIINDDTPYLVCMGY